MIVNRPSKLLEECGVVPLDY